VGKKDAALAEHARLSDGSWVRHEMRKLLRHALQLVQAELAKFNTIYKVTIGFENT
jgi:hypothetical protein